MRTEPLRGWATAIAWTRLGTLEGVSIAAYNRIEHVQRGLTIGIFNQARELHGVQIGILNYAGNNEGIARWLPIVNLHLD